MFSAKGHNFGNLYPTIGFSYECAKRKDLSNKKLTMNLIFAPSALRIFAPSGLRSVVKRVHHKSTGRKGYPMVMHWKKCVDSII